MESRSGISGTRAPRNSDYNRALTILLARLGLLNAVLVDALGPRRPDNDMQARLGGSHSAQHLVNFRRPSGNQDCSSACSTFTSLTVRGRPGRGSSVRPSSRPTRNRDRHFATVSRETPTSAATAWFGAPATQARMIRDRSARDCGLAPVRPAPGAHHQSGQQGPASGSAPPKSTHCIGIYDSRH